MTALDEIAAGIKHVDSLVAEQVLEPDPARGDWPSMRARVNLVVTALDEGVLAKLDTTLAEIEKGSDFLSARVASLVGEVAVLVRLAGEADAGAHAYRQGAEAPTYAALVARAKAIAPVGDVKDELTAAVDHADAFVRLTHGRWLAHAGKRDASDRVMKAVRKSNVPSTLKEAARKSLHAARPITSAPPLFRLNGCGFGLYGTRDERADGWHIATYFVSIFFLPVFPLAAYRVRNAGGGSWQFAAKERLGPVARAWQGVIVGGAAIALGAVGVQSYLDSPDRKVGAAIAEARALESSDRRAALEKYTATARDHWAHADVGEAALGAVRVAAAGVEEPATAASVDAIGRVVAAFDDLPGPSRVGKPAALLTERLEKWADQIGAKDVANGRAALTVLESAAHVADGGNDAPKVKARLGHARRELADRLVDARPLAALALYVKEPVEPASIESAYKIIDGFGDAPSLFVEAASSVEAWQHAASGPRVGQIVVRLREAKDAEKADAELAQVAELKTLTKEVAAHPGHQTLAAALAAQQRMTNPKDCVKTLEALGAPGRLTADAQQLLARCVADAGDLPRADRVLTDLVDERMAAFQAAQRAYHGAAQAKQEKYVSDAQLGKFPPDLETKLRLAPEGEQVGLFRTWLVERMQHDPELARLRDAFAEQGAVVPASIALGSIKLLRVRAASGAEKKKLLAEAERVLLAIRVEAEGDALFHLSLGQVYHRLGRTADADKEFAALLDRKDPEVSLTLAGTLRELGLTARARKIVEAVYADSKVEEKLRSRAALLRAHLATDLDDDLAWLQKADQKDDAVRELIDEAGAKRALRDGRFAEADRAFAKVAAARSARAAHDSASANNAATADLGRYQATGDVAHVRDAVKQLEAALRLEPDSALITENLADACEELGLLTVLDPYFQTKTLVPGTEQAAGLVSGLLEGPKREAVLAALAKEPSLARAAELTAQGEVLAPQRTDTYDRELRGYAWTRDLPATKAMRERLAAMPPFDTEELEARRKRWETGEDDAMYTKEGDSAIARAEDLVKRAQKAGHKPTLAAAYDILVQSLRVKLDVAHDLSVAPGILAAAKAAEEAWPDGHLEVEAQSALVEIIVERAAERSPVLAKAWKADSRRLMATTLAYRAATGEGGADVLAALRAQPEMAELARNVKRSLRGRPHPFDWFVGFLADDAELKKAAEGAFTREELHETARIALLLAPQEPSQTAELAWFEKPPVK
ncbi:MAG TPA: hypothetical protein VGM56_33690 [Byssovorax sp.]